MSDCRPWIALIGRSVSDAELRARLLAAGVEEPPVLAAPEVFTRLALDDGILLDLSAPALFPELSHPRDPGAAILMGVTLVLAEPSDPLYEGPLPYGLARGDTRARLHEKLGEPFAEDADLLDEQWHIEGRLLHVDYAVGFEEVERVSVMLPEPGE